MLTTTGLVSNLSPFLIDVSLIICNRFLFFNHTCGPFQFLKDILYQYLTSILNDVNSKLNNLEYKINTRLQRTIFDHNWKIEKIQIHGSAFEPRHVISNNMVV